MKSLKIHICPSGTRLESIWVQRKLPPLLLGSVIKDFGGYQLRDRRDSSWPHGSLRHLNGFSFLFWSLWRYLVWVLGRKALSYLPLRCTAQAGLVNSMKVVIFLPLVAGVPVTPNPLLRPSIPDGGGGLSAGSLLGPGLEGSVFSLEPPCVRGRRGGNWVLENSWLTSKKSVGEGTCLAPASFL